MKFKINGTILKFESALLLENLVINDARLFEDTLAVLSQMVFVDVASSPDYRSGLTGQHLSFVATKENLSVLANEILPNEFVLESPDDHTPGAVHHHTLSFNDFLSASGSYLAVTAIEDKEVFDHMETSTYRACQEYRDVSREVCSIKWKRIANPDYVPRARNTVRCGSDLRTCLSSLGPTLSRYIYVSDGEECSTIVSQECARYGFASSYPVYDHETKTKLIVYRFREDDFIKLEDTLSRVEGDTILLSSDPVAVQGRVSKHDHLNFESNILHVASLEPPSWPNESPAVFSTFQIAGNSIIQTSVLEDIAQGNRISAAVFSDETAYIQVSKRDDGTDLFNESSFVSIDLTHPETPVKTDEMTLAGDIEQFFAGSPGLIGIGSVRYETDANRSSLGRVSLMSSAGSELDSLILGTDYRFNQIGAGWDDQRVHWDGDARLLLVPYDSSSRVDPSDRPSRNRLALVQVGEDKLKNLATLDFDEAIERSLVVNPNIILAFSPHFISLLENSGTWHQRTLMSATLPQSVYHVPDLPYVLRREYKEGDFVIAVAHEDDIFSKVPVSELRITSREEICLPQSIYFTGNLVLEVSATPGIYESWEDCPDNRDELEIQIHGWRLNAEGSFEETPAEEDLSPIYGTIRDDIQCVMDTENFDGEVVEDDSIDPSTLTCMTREEYDRIRYEHISETPRVSF